jgi:hypothetical protein
MLVNEAFAAKENGSVKGRDGKGETGLRESVVLNFGGKGLDKNNGDEEDENTGERGSGRTVVSVSSSLGEIRFEALLFNVLSPRSDRFLLLRLLLRLLLPDTSPIEGEEDVGSFGPLNGSESRRGRGSCDFCGRFGRLSEFDFESLIVIRVLPSPTLDDLCGEMLGDFHWG